MMKKLTTFTAVLALAAGGTLLWAQDQERPQRDPPREGQRDGQREGQRDGQRGPRDGERGPGGPGGFRHPVIAVFDADNDGALSSEEINKAAETLRKLDRNEDGRVSADEMPRPQFGGFGGGTFGRGGFGGGGPGSFVERAMENDKDKDGKISREELESIDERFRAFYLRADANEDGAIDKAELERMAERFGQGGSGRRPGGDRGEGGDRPERPRRPERPEGTERPERTERTERP